MSVRHNYHAAVQPPPSKTVALELGAIYRAYAGTVARWAWRLGGLDIDVDDAVQEVFMTVDRLLPRYDPQRELVAWLYRVTENVVRHERRKYRWRRWLGGSPQEVEQAASEAGHSVDHFGAHDPDPAKALERREATKVLYAILNKLPEK